MTTEPRPSFLDAILGVKVGGARVVPIRLKIVGIFIVFLLLSNLISNYVNLTLNQSEQIRLTTDVLVRDLKDLYVFSSTQSKLYRQMGSGEDLFLAQIVDFAELQFKASKSLALAVRPDGSVLLEAGSVKGTGLFPDEMALAAMISAQTEGRADGPIEFMWQGERYFGIYRYSSDWSAFLLRAEEWNEFYEASRAIFTTVTIIIVVSSMFALILGVFLLGHILRFVERMTRSIMDMQKSQEMTIIDMTGAPNDDITYLGIAMNNLSSTIQNLVQMFRKFVARDVAIQAYKDREIRLEGSKRNLAIMFSDIKGFTFMTETLGNDIIKLLNLHYNKAIKVIHEHNGDIGSIIGDAILAVFGTMNFSEENKSLEAVRSGFKILVVAEELRSAMNRRREEYERSLGELPDEAEQIYEAVLLEVGVGIDGGEVFYGNIGSDERMVNTVIGDNVNSSSRLEGLTRVYKVPMIVSQYIKEEAERDSTEFFFLELDTVQVKGKTIGKKIFTVIDRKSLTPELKAELDGFQHALAQYYRGEWLLAAEFFLRSTLPFAPVFSERIKGRTVPLGWNGIWTMKDK